MRETFACLFLLCLAFYACGQDLSKGLLCRYDFAEKQCDLELKGHAKLSDGQLQLTGKGDFAFIPNSKDMHLSQNGLTLVATVKMNYDPDDKTLPNSVDMFFAKDKEFIFGKLHDDLYVNFHDGKNWCAHTLSKELPQSGEWAHVAAVIAYYSDAAQGEKGYSVSIYLNGNCGITRRFPDVKPAPLDVPVELGRGFGGGPWFMNGAFASAAIYGRALNQAEIAALCSKEKLVKPKRKGFFELEPELQEICKQIQNQGQFPAKMAANGILRAARTGYDQKKLLELASLSRLNQTATLEDFARKMNATINCRIIVTGQMVAMALTGQGKGAHPLVEVMDRRNNASVFGEKAISWSAKWYKGKQNKIISYNSPDVEWLSTVLGNTLEIIWTGKGDIPFDAHSKLCFGNARIESDFHLRNSSEYVLESVRYPEYAFAGLGEHGRLVHPYMSGIILRNPLMDMFRAGQSGVYPSGRVTMQFGAYYNEASKQGIYFGYEDGRALTKSYSAEGSRGNLLVNWENPVVADRQDNNFKMNGKAAIELYDGQWYEAGQIYRRFLEKEASWWLADLPRASTPQWFRDNALWIRLISKDKNKLDREVQELKYLRQYLDMPFCVHWYEWNDTSEYGWPHFRAKDFTPGVLKELQQAGIYVLPYVDDRLWNTQDGPNHSDWKYSSEGLKYAVKNRDGSINSENYGKYMNYTIMCPAARGWQDVLVSLTTKMARDGFSGLYHDQVGTGKPHLCYDTSHGHKLNDSSVWLEQGYWPIFARIFSILHKEYPDFCHTTEENAEPYMKQFDGFLAARWTEPEQIPLYQSLYAGRVQFVGRLYNCIAPGDAQSFFCKVAQQLVNAEQIGWFQPVELSRADKRRLFVKKAIHLRKALLPWFNQGTMQRPIDFGGTMKMADSIWGGYARQKVRLPVIASSAWRGGNGVRMWLFVNTQPVVAEAVPKIDAPRGLWICREGKAQPQFSKNAVPLRLQPYGFEVWIEGDKALAADVQKTLAAFATFDCGETAQSTRKIKYHSTKGQPGKLYGVADSVGSNNCTVSQDKSYFGQIQDGAVIAFGEIDFGSEGARSIEIMVAVHKQYEGGTIQMMTEAPGKPEVLSAVFPLKSTGGWRDFDFIRVPLKQPLTGRHYVSFIINGNSACNFSAWKYNAEAQ